MSAFIPKEFMVTNEFGPNTPKLDPANLRAPDEKTPSLSPEDKTMLFVLLVNEGCVSPRVSRILGVEPSRKPMTTQTIPQFYLDAAMRAKTLQMSCFDLHTLYAIRSLAKNGTGGNMRDLKTVMRTFGWTLPKGTTKKTGNLRDFLIVVAELIFSNWTAKEKRGPFVANVRVQLGLHQLDVSSSDDNVATNSSVHKVAVMQHASESTDDWEKDAAEEESVLNNVKAASEYVVIRTHEDVPDDWDA